jgi:predicted phosphodiesterase
MMRIALISDIHGNKFALDKVLDEIDNDPLVERIYCLGDMVGLGLFSNEVLETIFSRDDIYPILGNHDELVMAMAKGEDHTPDHHMVIDHHRYLAERLDRRFLDKLESLPRFIRVNLEGWDLLFLHYHLEKGMENDHISKRPYSPLALDTASTTELFSDCVGDLIAYGHRHYPPSIDCTSGRLLVDPGSLGISTRNFATYAIVDITADSMEAEIREVEYSRKEFAESYPKAGIPGYEFILTSFLGMDDY